MLKRPDWETLLNSHQGETCLVIGNGPSLKDMPLDFLKKYPSFGSNRIYLLKDFCPTYYVAVNPLVIQQSTEEILKIGSEVLFISESVMLMDDRILRLQSIGYPFFSDNPQRGLYEGFTVTYVMLQLAFYMGFSKVLLVGVDHSYVFDGAPNEQKIAVGADLNHFDPAYFSDGTKWNNPDLENSEEAYRLARQRYDIAGRTIVNLTPGTKLDVFPKDDWRKYA